MLIHKFIFAVPLGIAVFISGAMAQEWGWESRNYDRERQRPASSYQQPRQQNIGTQNPRCKELEFQLSGGFANSGGQDQLVRIEAEMRQAETLYYRAKSDAERGDCYEDMFLFGRAVRRNQRCLDLDRQVQSAQSRLASLRSQRDAIARGSSRRSRRDDLIAELARNRCGDNYAREYEQQRSRSNSIFSFFSDEDPNDQSRSDLPYSSSTFKTMCVRLCDGFYFPISYATTESQFPVDAQKCQSQCAAPSELFVSRTDQDIDQANSLQGRPYSQLPNAFRNRKVYIKGCSCNASEFSREEIAKSEDTLRQPPVKRADAGAKTVPDTPPPANTAPAQNAPSSSPR